MIGDTRLAGSVAILHDMAEEGWPSMDQMGHLLTTRVPALAPGLTVTPIYHTMTRLTSRFGLADGRLLFPADRVLNRMVLYPRRVKRFVSGRFDIYHVVDHSYAQLALALPAHRTIVSCHDIDTFRSLVQPAEDRRGRLFNAMTRRILAGLRRAAVVVCGSAAVHDDLVRFGLVDPARLRTVLNGIDPGLLEPASAAARSRAAELLPSERGVVDLLHVGNDIPRKRLDRLVDIVATLRRRGHRIRLVRVGSRLREQTRRRMCELGVSDVIELPFIDRGVLRAIYERCNLLALTSDREGYGLPVLEAFAAGKPVVASDIPALRESSGGLATLVPADSLDEWVSAIERVLRSDDPGGPLAAERRRHAAARTWDEHVRGVLPVYAEVLGAR
jgi:glycosyltransferase involved in cell wall biosynthesis